ncbi:MAG: sugar transporter permease, partial [Devosia sp.]|nr:sugar transporter permease [Devosia sp.]
MAVDTLEPRGMRPRPFFTPRKIIIYSLLFFVSVYYLFPMYVMIVTSLKDLDEVRGGNIFALPVRFTFDPWFKAWNSACTGLYCEGLKVGFFNSVKITVPSVIVSVLIASINGYALVNWRFKGSEVFFVILLFGSFIPYQVMLYPMVIILRELKMFSTLQGVILIHTIFGMPILTLLFRNYFASLPPELFKAARVDGA